MNDSISTASSLSSRIPRSGIDRSPRNCVTRSPSPCRNTHPAGAILEAKSDRPWVAPERSSLVRQMPCHAREASNSGSRAIHWAERTQLRNARPQHLCRPSCCRTPLAFGPRARDRRTLGQCWRPPSPCEGHDTTQPSATQSARARSRARDASSAWTTSISTPLLRAPDQQISQPKSARPAATRRSRERAGRKRAAQRQRRVHLPANRSSGLRTPRQRFGGQNPAPRSRPWATASQRPQTQHATAPT